MSHTSPPRTLLSPEQTRALLAAGGRALCDQAGIPEVPKPATLGVQKREVIIRTRHTTHVLVIDLDAALWTLLQHEAELLGVPLGQHISHLIERVIDARRMTAIRESQLSNSQTSNSQTREA